ncbi:MAG: hypothetical protein Q9217_003695 [Psora testacea]
MASTTTSQHRAQLLREMNKTHSSSSLSRHSQSSQPTLSDFDPENEAMMSTRQLDNHASKLPDLHASAQRSQWPPPAEPDYAINTSAIGRAFPDFSQGNNSSDETSMSIEVGRGDEKGKYGTVGRLGRSRQKNPRADMNLGEDSMDFSTPMIDSYEVAGTPPVKQRSTKNTADTVRATPRSNARRRRSSGLRNEIEPSPPAKTKDYGSGESRKGSDGSRCGLAAMHARVRDENDMSRISEERPPTIDLTVRNTRFGSGKGAQDALSNGLPTTFSNSKGLQHSKSAPKHEKNPTATPQGTQQSFMLPDLPNISELVSGVFEDGTPVFSRQRRARSSRLASYQSRSDRQNHAPVTEVALPSDEQAIFLSLKLLQDKVAVLEEDKAQAESAVKSLEEKNRWLQAEKPERRRLRHRSDSALGTTDSDGGDEMVDGGQRKAVIEKNSKAPRISTSKVSTAETMLQNITQERDSTVSQLGVAYITIEQLKNENESLKKENSHLKGLVSQLTNAHESEKQQWTAKENALQRKVERRTEAVMATRDITNNIASRSPRKKSSRTQFQDHSQASRTGLKPPSAGKDDEDLFDLTPRHQETTGKSTKDKVSPPILDDEFVNEDSTCERPCQGKVVEKQRAFRRPRDCETEDPSKDLTYLSFFDSEEIAKLRKTLEQEHIEQKQRNAARRQLLQLDCNNTKELQHETQEESTKPTVQRTSSLKDLASKPNPTSQHDLPAAKGQADAQHNRRHSETSMLSTRSRRRVNNADNMTSGFILPDITIQAPASGAEKTPNPTKENGVVSDMVAKHNTQNCTICKLVGHGENHEHLGPVKEAITVSKPVPVSERIPEAMSGEDEPTMRPSQTPGLALATVLQGLEDEIAHLKIKLAQYQVLYNTHDPSLSKRKRKSCYQKMETLLQAIDVKADQIYALYDVLEGQKEDGQDMTQEKVEITLQSIGVDVPRLHLRGGGLEEETNEQRREGHPWELTSEGGSGEDLPWEGIESTVETTKSAFTRVRGRRE